MLQAARAPARARDDFEGGDMSRPATLLPATPSIAVPHPARAAASFSPSPHGASPPGLPRLARAAAGPQGQLTWAVHVSLAPTWFDPAETSGIITPYMVLYALHDALVKPMPGKLLAPSLAESGRRRRMACSYDFVLRPGITFHNGDPVTAEDVKFSFERYRGASHDMMKARVAAIETPDARHVQFRLKEPWPDFLTFYGSATGAGWIVPKKYVEKVGDEGFKKAPVGAGPYKFASFTPGVELALEANEHYWRKEPSIKRIVLKSIPDETTRLAALKGGEVDGIYWVAGQLAAELQRSPGLTLAVSHTAPFWVYFPEQWDPKSPWSDVRVRHAASLAIDRKNINEAITFGHSRLTGNSFVPPHFEFYWQPPEPLSTTSPRRSSCWPRPAMPMASTPARSIAMPPFRISARRSSTACSTPASAPACSRSSAPASTRAIPKRNSKA